MDLSYSLFILMRRPHFPIIYGIIFNLTGERLGYNGVYMRRCLGLFSKVGLLDFPFVVVTWEYFLQKIKK